MTGLLLDSLGGYGIAVGILGIMIAIAGILLGLGYATNDKKLKDLGTGELYQTLVNGIIIGTLFFAFSGSGILTLLINSLTNGLISQASCPGLDTTNTAICFASAYLVGSGVTINGTVQSSLLSTATFNMLVPLSTASVILGMLSSVKVDASVFSIGFQGAFTPFLNQINYAMTATTFAIIGISVQGILINFVSATVIPVLLPAGIVLRTFYFTRSLGGAIIATAIGLYAIFPMTYVLDAQLTNTYINSSASTAATNFLTGAEELKSGLLSAIGSVNIFSGNFLNIQSIGSSISTAVTGYNTIFSEFMQVLVNSIALMIVEVFFLPTFSLILTIVAIRELTNILGSEISFSNFDVF